MSSKNSISSKVSHLLLAGRPLAIGWFVMTVSVLSFYRHVWRAFTHVGKKVWKTVPSFADLNAFSSVVLIALLILIRAPSPHRNPNAIRFGFVCSVGMSVRCFVRHNGISVFASGGHSAETGDRCAILSNFHSRHKLSGGPNWSGEWFPHSAFLNG